MNDDMKWVLLIVVACVVLPLLGLGVSEWRHQDCRVELAKANKTVEEIKELCK